MLERCPIDIYISNLLHLMLIYLWIILNFECYMPLIRLSIHQITAQHCYKGFVLWRPETIGNQGPPRKSPWDSEIIPTESHGISLSHISGAIIP